MKRILALLLALVTVLSFAACGGSESADGANGESKSDTAAGKNETENKLKDITFTEMVVADNDECLIKITGAGEGSYSDFALDVQLENKSADKKYMFSVMSASVNGVETDPLFATEVAAGKKSNDEIEFYDDYFDGNDIGDYTDIELTFRVYDSEDWEADEVVNETVHVYPYGEDKATKFVRKAESSDNVIADNENVKATVIGYEEDEYGYYVKFFFENKTDVPVMFNTEDVSLNGYMCDPFFAVEVGAGKCYFAEMSWYETTLEEESIDNIETIEFVFEAYPADDWDAENYVEEQITLNP